MYPHERSLVSKYPDRFIIVGVNSDKSREKLREVMEENDITWPSFYDGGSTRGPIATAWGITYWPTIFLLDAEGVIRYKDIRGEKLEKAIEELLAEMPPG